MLYAQSVGLAKTLLYPLKTPSFQVTKSHAGIARSYKTKSGLEWNNVSCEVKKREEKNLTFLHISTGHNQFQSLFQPKGKNGHMRKKVFHRRQEKKWIKKKNQI